MRLMWDCAGVSFRKQLIRAVTSTRVTRVSYGPLSLRYYYLLFLAVAFPIHHILSRLPFFQLRDCLELDPPTLAAEWPKSTRIPRLPRSSTKRCTPLLTLTQRGGCPCSSPPVRANSQLASQPPCCGCLFVRI